MMYREVLAELVSNKCKITPQRKEIIKIMIRAKQPLSARQVFTRMQKHFPDMSFDTVYRNLALLTELHILNRLDYQDTGSTYELMRQRQHWHHLVCLKCGETWRLDTCPLEHVRLSNMPEDFTVVNHKFELFGYCKDCKNIGEAQ